MTQQFCTKFCPLYTHFLFLVYSGDRWIYSTISSLALCSAEKAFRSRQAYCIRFCSSYRWGINRSLRDRNWGFRYFALAEEQNGESGPETAKCLNNLVFPSVDILTWSNCASSPLWRDRDRGFSCKMGESVKDNPSTRNTIMRCERAQGNKITTNLPGFSKTSLSQIRICLIENLRCRCYLQSHFHHCCWTAYHFQRVCIYPLYALSILCWLICYSTELPRILQWHRKISTQTFYDVSFCISISNCSRNTD